MTVSPRRRAPRRSLADTAYERIYRRIMTLEYEPGRRLEEKDLVAELGIGRTPVREALLRLGADFMVESHPSRGFLVRSITLQNTRAAFAALRILELGVAGLAVRRHVTEALPAMAEANHAVAQAVAANDVVALVEANAVFHQRFAECSGNDYLIQALHKVRCEINRLAYLSFRQELDPGRSLAEHYRSVVAHHDQLVRHLGERDGEALAATVSEHVEAFQRRILLYMAT
ncbi:MAG: GntR family transcriptional regulator [Deferrisomatales bacterium]|nr:GntR family transcriptional regulator [Deferrisomatales bacterium]